MRADRCRVAAGIDALVGLALWVGGLAGCQPTALQPESVAQQAEVQALTPQPAAAQDSTAQPRRGGTQPGTNAAGADAHSPALVGDSAGVITQTAPLQPAGTTADASWRIQLAAILAGKQDTLRLEDQPITPQQLEQLSLLAGSLEQLLIDAGGVDADSLPAILELKGLTHLRLRECPLGDVSFEQLAASGLDKLRILNVPQAQVTARGITSLAALPKLVQLRLGGAQIGDAAVVEIARLPELRSLHLIGPSLTDAALSALAQAPKLSTFYLDDCRLSDQAWIQLFAAKPKLHVHVDQQHHDRDPHKH